MNMMFLKPQESDVLFYFYIFPNIVFGALRIRKEKVNLYGNFLRLPPSQRSFGCFLGLFKFQRHLK